MLRAVIKIVTLPIVLPVKIVARLLRPRRLARRRIQKKALLAIGAAAAVAVNHHRKQQ